VMVEASRWAPSETPETIQSLAPKGVRT